MFVLSVPAFAAPWRTAYWEPVPNDLPYASIPANKYTHVIRAFVYPTYNGSTCGVDSSWSDSTGGAAGFISAVHAGGAKALVSIADPPDTSIFGTCTGSAHLSQFASAIAAYVNSAGYDGIDVDWEQGQSEPNYANLFPALRSALGSSKLVTLGCLSITVRAYVNNPTVYNAIDQMNFCEYDSDAYGGTSGSPLPYTWHNSNLHPDSSIPDAGSADLALGYLTGAGIPISKIGLGLPFYGRVKTGNIAGNCSAFVDAPKQTYCSGNGLTNGRNPITYASLTTSKYLAGTHVTDSTVGTEYYKYDNGGSTAFVSATGPWYMGQAAAYIKSKGLGGAMVWDLQFEYLTGKSGDAAYPLSTALYAGLVGGSSGPSCDVNADGTTNVSDVQSCVNQALGVTTCSSCNLTQASPVVCNAVDVQRDVNAALGGSCVVGP